MKHGLFAVRDKCAKAFLPPFCLPSEAMAMREFAAAANMADHKFRIHASDFSLYKVADYDDVSGLVTGMSEPFFLCSALQFQEPSAPKADQEELPL